MEKRPEFDDIRPYYDDEFPSAMAKLIKDVEFEKNVKSTFPDKNWDELRKLLLSFKNKYDFQHTIIKESIFALLDKTANQVDCTGFENVSNTGAYTYISNHRDIVLDAAILCVLLSNAGFDTCEICLGDNLLAQQWIADIVRLNKGILVKRGVGIRQQYEASMQLSSYIHYAVNDKKQSVWIAQREGRAKNSNDKTQSSLVKMLGMTGGKNLLENIANTNLVPIALSYEFDPCDFLKAKEYQLKRDNPEYKKTKEDDVLNMRTGILGYKGNIHFQISRPINQFLSTITSSEKNEQVEELMKLIDNEIYLNYRFYPINYIAYDKLWGNNDTFRSKYTEKDIEKVENYFQSQLDKINIPNKDIPFLTGKLLEMYAYPLKNHLEAIK